MKIPKKVIKYIGSMNGHTLDRWNNYEDNNDEFHDYKTWKELLQKFVLDTTDFYVEEHFEYSTKNMDLSEDTMEALSELFALYNMTL